MTPFFYKYSMKAVINIAEKFGMIRTIITTLVVVLPIIGTQLGDFAGWASTVYNLRTELAKTVKIVDSMEVLLYIEESLYDDVTVDQLAIRDMIETSDMPENIRKELLAAHFKSYNQKILKLERIRSKIKILDPTWKSREEINNGQVNTR